MGEVPKGHSTLTINAVFSFCISEQAEQRKEVLDIFLNNVIDKEEWPFFVSDEATVYDISTLTNKELLLRIETAYGKKLKFEDLKLPLWKLLDIM